MSTQRTDKPRWAGWPLLISKRLRLPLRHRLQRAAQRVRLG